MILIDEEGGLVGDCSEAGKSLLLGTSEFLQFIEIAHRLSLLNRHFANGLVRFALEKLLEGIRVSSFQCSPELFQRITVSCSCNPFLNT